MISLYSGTPGSGKSLHVARVIYDRLRLRKQTVITNMYIDRDYCSRGIFGRKKNIGDVIMLKNTEITSDYFIDYAMKNHVRGRESQTLIVIDEAQMLFSPSVIKLKCQEEKDHRVKWLDFFSQHRHLGYDVILVTQFDRLLDAQVRCMIEYNNIHRCINRFGSAWILSLFGLKIFVAVQMWYGVRAKCGHEFFTYRKKFSRVYDSYSRFESPHPPSPSNDLPNEVPPLSEADEVESAEEARQSFPASVCNEEQNDDLVLTIDSAVIE